MVLYFIRNIHLDSLNFSKYWMTLLSFLREELDRVHKSKSGCFLLGWYNGIKVDHKLIKVYPFEILVGISSTIARLHALEKWSEITSCGQILCQPSFKYMFGFTIKSLKTFYGNFIFE